VRPEAVHEMTMGGPKLELEATLPYLASNITANSRRMIAISTIALANGCSTALMLVAERVGRTYRCSLSVVILTGVPRRCGGTAKGPLIVSVDFQLSAPELAVEACRSAATSRLVIVVGSMVSDLGAPLPSERARRGGASLGCCGLHCCQRLVRW